MKITFILTAIVPVLLVMKANGGGSSYMQWISEPTAGDQQGRGAPGEHVC